MKNRIQSVLRNTVAAIMALVLLGVSVTFGLAILGFVSAVVIVGLIGGLITQRGDVYNTAGIFTEIHPSATGTQ